MSYMTRPALRNARAILARTVDMDDPAYRFFRGNYPRLRAYAYVRWRTELIVVIAHHRDPPMVRPACAGDPRLQENEMKDSFRSQRRFGSRAAVLVTLVLLVPACASTPPAPTASLGAARFAISNAEKADAGRYASPELSEARQKLAAADVAVMEKSAKGMITAQRLAEQSRVEADLALAMSTEAKSTSVNDEMKRSNDVLVEEMQRKTGGQP